LSTPASPVVRLRAGLERLGAPLCLGIDPNIDALPDGLSRDVHGVEQFARGILEAAADAAVAVKVNVAFFEAFGSAGWSVLERLRSDVPSDHVLILDAKRGDIGATAERQAASLLGELGADGVTLSPYLGQDAIEPFLAYPDRLVYVLARTSNPSAGTFQELRIEGTGQRLHERVGEWVADRWPEPRVGLVVGATAAEDLVSLRRLLPGPAFLVPGVGAQGGDVEAAVRSCHGQLAPGLVNVTRGIAAASTGADWRQAAAAAAHRWRGIMAEAGATLAS
jgi:orotidine-5'-phosphate decarboxylase